MNGDPAALAVASIYAFGGTAFDARGALASLVRAATVPTAHDRSAEGCGVACIGQRPALDQWLKLHYIAAKSNSWAGAAETLESATADFGVAALAGRLGDAGTQAKFLARANYWRNVFNPSATAHGGYIQDRNADGSWAAFDPARDDGFVQGSAAQYLWMVPFNVQALSDALGGRDKTNARLDAFFRHRRQLGADQIGWPACRTGQRAIHRLAMGVQLYRQAVPHPGDGDAPPSFPPLQRAGARRRLVNRSLPREVGE